MGMIHFTLLIFHSFTIRYNASMNGVILAVLSKVVKNFLSQVSQILLLFVDQQTRSYRLLKRWMSSVKTPYFFSVPIFTYAAEIKKFSYSDMNECNIALNDSIRRIFSYHRWESIRSLRQQLGYQDLYTIFATRRRNFFNNFRYLRNHSILTLWKHINEELA